MRNSAADEEAANKAFYLFPLTSFLLEATRRPRGRSRSAQSHLHFDSAPASCPLFISAQQQAPRWKSLLTARSRHGGEDGGCQGTEEMATE